MARFRNLELDPEPDEPRNATNERGDAERDDGYWLRLADENRRQGHYENALRFYSRALELDKSLVQGWVGQVQMLIAQEEFPEAELWARKALELFRNHGDLLAGRAQAIGRKGNHTEAVALCDGALSQAGHSAYRWVVRGELLIKENQDLDRHCFDKAIMLEPDWLIPVEIAGIYSYYQVPTKAVARLRQALELVPDNPFVWYRKGCCEVELDLLRAARQSFERCLELAPKHVEATHALSKFDSVGWSVRHFLRRLLPRRR